MSDQLTPLERLQHTIEGKKTDRLGVLAITKMFGIKQAGTSVADCFNGPPDQFVKTQWDLVTKFSHEALWGYSGFFPINEVLDPTTIRATQDDLFIQRRYLKSSEEVKSLPEIAIQDKGHITWSLNIIRKLKGLSQGRYPVFGWISLPFEAAWMLRGPDIYMDLIEAPDRVHELLEYCLKLHIEYALKMREAGADVIWTTNPVVNTECISKKHYRKFSYDVDCRFFTTLRSMGIWTMSHVCGDWSDRLEEVFNMGAHIYYLSKKFDLAAVKKSYGTKCVLMGNVPAVDTLYQGTTEDVRREAARCIEVGVPGGNYILGGDCSIPRDTPPQNLAVLFEMARKTTS
jgi:uroporphyrinogen decarboxylase